MEPWINWVFRSGMSSRSDLRGAIEAQVPVGVVAGLLTSGAQLMTLPQYLDAGGRVFVDSGAFHAVRSSAPMNWAKILGVYRIIAEMTDYPERLYVVAPDVIGDQAGSVALLDIWHEALLELLALGCQLIVPIQSGPIPANVLVERIAERLGTREFVVGVPSNLAAMTAEECATLQHDRFHILGRVQADGDQILRVQALRRHNRHAIITADANWLRGNMRQIQALTEAERTREGRTAGSFDHPRVAAVRLGIENDRQWGQKPSHSEHALQGEQFALRLA